MEQKKYDFKKQGGVKEECQSLWIYCAIHRDDTLFFEKKEKKSEMTLCCSYWSLKCVDLYATIIYLYRITQNNVSPVMLLQLYN